ncbi:tectonin domain-containing protein [Thalassospira sp. CH_XMU1448-2]|uniref:tectonin domain-containing protein n=1 Tax=Thalassospira sp. CH_XMU1448-2 TaxID=3107773 RepID=UPI00300B1FC5
MEKLIPALIGAIGMVLYLVIGAAPGTAQEPPAAPWISLSGTIADIAINGDGQAYAVGLDGTVWRWDLVETRWRPMSGKMTRIAAADGNRPWAVSQSGAAFRYNGLWWEEWAKDVRDVGADSLGNVYIAKTDGSIFKWYDLRSEWRPVPGAAIRLAVDGDALLWVIAPDGTVQSFDGKNWQSWNGRARDIAAGGTGQVGIATPEGDVRLLSDADKAWVKVGGIAGVVTLAIAPDSAIWAVQSNGGLYSNKALPSTGDPNQKQQAKTVTAPSINAQVITPQALSAPVEVADSIAAPNLLPQTIVVEDNTPTADRSSIVDPASVTASDPITFFDTRKTADQIAIGKDGSIFALDSNGNVLRWSNSRRDFESFPGSLVRIAVDPNGVPWGISNLGRVFFNTGQRWEQVRNVTASDIAIGSDGTVAIASASGRLFLFDEDSKRFNQIQGSGIEVAVSPEGIVWTINSDKFVQRCDTVPCKILPQKVRSISIGPDGRVWVVSDQRRLMRLKDDGSAFEIVPSLGQELRDVASGPNGLPWFVSTGQKVYASSYFDRDESADRLVAARSSGDTVGTGDSETPLSNNTASITFTKNIPFETLDIGDMTASESSIQAGNDGLVYTYSFTARNIAYYDELKRAFSVKSTTIGNHGLDLNGFVVDSEGGIWGNFNNQSEGGVSYEGLYRELDKKLTAYDAPCDTLENLAIAPDDTLYVVCSASSGNNKLYRKAANSKTFTEIKSSANVFRVSIGRAQDIWITDVDGYVYQWDGRDFAKRPRSGQTASAISVGSEGTVYILSSSKPRKWNPANQSFDKVANIDAHYITVDQNGRPWTSYGQTPVIKRAR